MTPDEALSTIDTNRASIMSAKFYNGRRSLGDLIRSLIQSGLSLPEVRARLVSQINVSEIVVVPDLPKGWRPELMSRDKVMIAAGNDTFVDADSFRYYHPLTRALLDRFAPSPSQEQQKAAPVPDPKPRPARQPVKPQPISPPPPTKQPTRKTPAARSGMARLGINLPVIEKFLNHSSGSFGGIVGVYQRHNFSDEKRHALERWGAHVANLVADRRSQNIVVEIQV